MADTSVVAAGSTSLEQRNALWGPYWTSTTVGAFVYFDDSDIPNYARTIDGGANWSLTAVGSNTSCKLCAYFDRETPEYVANSLLHIWWIEVTSGVLKYRTLDIASDTLGTERTVATLATGETALQTCRLYGAKLRGGNLLCGGWVDATTDAAFSYRSTDAGANWTSRAAAHESDVLDSGRLYPADTGDDADAALIYHDYSADEVSVKMYDDSGDSWAETSIATGINPATNNYGPNYDGALRHSDGLIVCAFWTEVDAAGSDLITHTVNPNSIAAPTIAAGANVLTDSGESGTCAVAINQQNNDVYVAYITGATFQTAVGAKYKVSTDDLGSWDTQVAYSEDTDDDLRWVSGPRTIGDAGGFIQWSFYNDDLLDIYVNLNNDVAISAVAAAAIHAGPRVNINFLKSKLSGLVN